MVLLGGLYGLLTISTRSSLTPISTGQKGSSLPRLTHSNSSIVFLLADSGFSRIGSSQIGSVERRCGGRKDASTSYEYVRGVYSCTVMRKAINE
jgi:hypothetical protein